MTDWREHLTDDEQARLEAIQAEHSALTAERRRIYDRAKARAKPIMDAWRSGDIAATELAQAAFQQVPA